MRREHNQEMYRYYCDEKIDVDIINYKQFNTMYTDFGIQSPGLAVRNLSDTVSDIVGY